MTIFFTNLIPTATPCSFCQGSYRNGELKDTAKVVELACHHFSHKECVAKNFIEDEAQGQDLTCRSCNQISLPKRSSIDYHTFCLENFIEYLSTLKSDPYYRLQPPLLDAIKELERRIPSVRDLLATIIPFLLEQPLPNEQAVKAAFLDWIAINIPKDSRLLCGKIIATLFTGEHVLLPIEKEIEYLSSIEPQYRSLLIPKEGVPVLDYKNDGTLFRMRVSKKFMVRAIKDYEYSKKYTIPNFNKIHNLGKFKDSLFSISRDYAYDIEVSSCLDTVENLREDISSLISSHSSLPAEKILSLIDKKINSQLNTPSKATVSLIIKEILLERGALRTLSQEVSRWRNHPPDQWPVDIREKGIYFLDNENRVKFCYTKDFEKLITDAKHFDTIHNVGKFEERIQIIQACYSYDPEVVEAIRDLKKLRKEISQIIENNSALPMKDILLCIQEMILKKKISNSSKATIPLLIREILFERGALRTLDQEVERWKKEPIERWPSPLQETGITFLGKDDSVKHCDIKDFEKFVQVQRTSDTISQLTVALLVGVTTFFYVKNTFPW